MKVKLTNMGLKEFEKFLKKFKNKKTDTFEVQGIGGVDVLFNEKKIASIYQQISNSREGFKAGDVVANTDTSERGSGLLVSQRIEKAKKIWKELGGKK